jgi:hypothetical protein
MYWKGSVDRGIDGVNINHTCRLILNFFYNLMEELSTLDLFC